MRDVTFFEPHSAIPIKNIAPLCSLAPVSFKLFLSKASYLLNNNYYTSPLKQKNMYLQHLIFFLVTNTIQSQYALKYLFTGVHLNELFIPLSLTCPAVCNTWCKFHCVLNASPGAFASAAANINTLILERLRSFRLS